MRLKVNNLENSKSAFERVAFWMGVACAACLVYGPARVQAQDLDNPLRSIFQMIQQASQLNSAINPSSSSSPASPSPADMLPGSTAAVPAPSEAAPWQTKQAFLQAARNGELRNIGNLDGDEKLAITRSIAAVLKNDYGIGAIDLSARGACQQSFGAVTWLFQHVTRAHMDTLSNNPPTFTRDSSPEQSARTAADLQQSIKNIQSSRDYCEQTVFGMNKSSSYKNAAPLLLTEYGQATGEWVAAERARRQSVYAGEQAAQARRAAQQRSSRVGG